MLASVSVLLSLALAVGGVAEVSVAPETSGPTASSASISTTALTITEATTAASVAATTTRASASIALLDRLGSMPADAITTFVRSNPSSVSAMLVSPPVAQSVVSWWSGLTRSARGSLSAAAPGLVGNLDGVPFAVRDAANRAALAAAISEAKSTSTSGIGRARITTARHHLDILTEIARTLKVKKGQPARQLLTFDPTGEGRAAVVVGDLATADYVSYLVPGMFFTVEGQMYDWTAIAQDLQTEQAAWIKRLSPTTASLAGATAATVAWIGYSTPGVLGITSLALADKGANYLGNAVRGIQATRSTSEPYVTLVTHSYGSTTAMIELAKGGITVDALAIVGSPGGGATTAAALNVRNGSVFVGEAAWDPVATSAVYGTDPGSAAFGAKTMDVAGGTDSVTDAPLAAAVGHLGYFDAGTRSMRNLALIGLDQDALVMATTTGTIRASGK